MIEELHQNLQYVRCRSVFCKNRGLLSQPQKNCEIFSLFSSCRNYKLGSDDFRANLITDWMDPHPYFFIIIFIGVALLFPLGPLALAWMWRRFFQPPKPGPDKTSTYECGVESIGDAQIQFHAQYYLYAILFLIFDVEAVFLVPFAVAFTGLPFGAFIAILVFLLLLIEGLVWAWGKGCLQWQR